MAKIKLANAEINHLRDFATKTCGIPVNPSWNKDKLRAEIAKVFEGDEIEINEVAVPTQSPTVSAPPRPSATPTKRFSMVDPLTGRADPTVRVVIHQQEGPGGKDPIPVAVNGTAILLPRQMEIDIAYRYYAALKEAVRTVYEPTAVQGEYEERTVPAYPFSVIAMPSTSEVDEWKRLDELSSTAHGREILKEEQAA